MVNGKLMYRVLGHIKANPEKWDQQRFSCCFAGWTLRLTDAEIKVINDDTTGVPMVTRNGVVLSPLDIDREAAALLGLSREQQIQLFCGGNILGDLERYVAAFTAA